MKLRHRGVELGGQVARAQMHIDQGGLNVAVAGEDCDFVDIPVGPRKIGQAEMAQGMRSKACDASTLCDGRNDL